MFTIFYGSGFLTTIQSALEGGFGRSIASICGAILIIFGIVQLVRGIISEQQRGSRLAWGGIAFVIGAFLTVTNALSFLKTQGNGTAGDIGLR